MRLKEAEKKKRAKIVLKILNKTYPEISVPLNSRNCLLYTSDAADE